MHFRVTVVQCVQVWECFQSVLLKFLQLHKKKLWCNSPVLQIRWLVEPNKPATSVNTVSKAAKFCIIKYIFKPLNLCSECFLSIQCQKRPNYCIYERESTKFIISCLSLLAAKNMYNPYYILNIYQRMYSITWSHLIHRLYAFALYVRSYCGYRLRIDMLSVTCWYISAALSEFILLCE